MSAKRTHEDTLATCPVCIEIAVPPVVLWSCGHCVCGPCLRKLQAAAAEKRSSSSGRVAFDCPECRRLITTYVVPMHARQQALEHASTEQALADLEFMQAYALEQHVVPSSHVPASSRAPAPLRNQVRRRHRDALKLPLLYCAHIKIQPRSSQQQIRSLIMYTLNMQIGKVIEYVEKAPPDESVVRITIPHLRDTFGSLAVIRMPDINLKPLHNLGVRGHSSGHSYTLLIPKNRVNDVLSLRRGCTVCGA